MRQFKLSPDAVSDVDEIYDYLWQRNPRAADGTIDAFAEAFQLLVDYPLAGMARRELKAELRMFPVSSYVIYYEYSDEVVLVLRVLHSARDVDALFE